MLLANVTLGVIGGVLGFVVLAGREWVWVLCGVVGGVERMDWLVIFRGDIKELGLV